MHPEHIKRFLGIPVIVQLRDAIAIGAPKDKGEPHAAPVTDAAGNMFLKDGSIAPDGAKAEELKLRAVWPIVTDTAMDGSAVFRYAIENAIVSVIEETLTEAQKELRGSGDPAWPTVPALVRIHYLDDESGTLFELVVEPQAIIGITQIRQGPAPKPPQPRIVVPGS